MNKNFSHCPFTTVILIILFISTAVFLLCSQTQHVLFVQHDGVVALSFSICAGETFTTEYIHSIELSPVLDVYMVMGGNLWAWEERTRTSNAGMPTEPPERGRYYVDPPWFCYQGGRMLPHVNFRVGDDRFGRNRLFLPNGDVIDLYKLFAGKRLKLTTSSRQKHQFIGGASWQTTPKR